MNAPLRQALALAARMDCDEAEFFRMADLALETGVFYSGPDALLIAFEEPDCWHLWMAVGTPGKFFHLAPHPKPFIAWARSHRGDHRVKRLSWSRANSLLHHDHERTKATEDPAGSASDPGHCAPAHGRVG